MKLVTAEQMRHLEQACESRGISTDQLMERAGLQVARDAYEMLGGAAGKHVLVLVGPGNNGGDGLVAARHLARWGATVTVYHVTRQSLQNGKLPDAIQSGASSVSSGDDPSYQTLQQLLSTSHLVIDAVLGTGVSRPLEGPINEVMKLLATARESNSNLGVLALDLPTGLNADTGETDPHTPFADLTVTLGFPKVGLFCIPGAARVGRLKIVDIGIPYELAEDVRLELLTDDWVRERLPRRPLDAHKGTFGHLLVIAGSRRYVGAACLASETAARAGAGLVTLAAPKGLHPIVAAKLTEVIHLPLPEDSDGVLHPAAADVVKRELAAYNALLVGCGLGSSQTSQEFIKKLLVEEPRPPMPVVIDADGLNNLSRVKDWSKHLTPQTILTPHPGEMARLTGLKTEGIQKRRHETALEWAARWEKVVVLKGAHTVIASPDGYCRISPFANPLLATAGTGDVLAGVIASLLAQGLTPADAACVGVYVHGLAAELLKPRFGTTGALASDVMNAIPEAITSLSQNK